MSLCSDLDTKNNHYGPNNKAMSARDLSKHFYLDMP